MRYYDTNNDNRRDILRIGVTQVNPRTIRFAEVLAKDLAYRYELLIYPQSQLASALEKGEVDLFINPTPEEMGMSTL